MSGSPVNLTTELELEIETLDEAIRRIKELESIVHANSLNTRTILNEIDRRDQLLGQIWRLMTMAFMNSQWTPQTFLTMKRSFDPIMRRIEEIRRERPT